MVQHAARLLVVHFAIENGRGTSRIWETHFPNSASEILRIEIAFSGNGERFLLMHFG